MVEFLGAVLPSPNPILVTRLEYCLMPCLSLRQGAVGKPTYSILPISPKYFFAGESVSLQRDEKQLRRCWQIRRCGCGSSW